MDMYDWIIVNRPGLVPERKGPFFQHADIASAMNDIYRLYPDCTCTLICAPRESYPQCGREWLDIYYAEAGEN